MYSLTFLILGLNLIFLNQSPEEAPLVSRRNVEFNPRNFSFHTYFSYKFSSKREQLFVINF